LQGRQEIRKAHNNSNVLRRIFLSGITGRQNMKNGGDKE
jgi:hypothetical protein